MRSNTSHQQINKVYAKLQFLNNIKDQTEGTTGAHPVQNFVPNRNPPQNYEFFGNHPKNADHSSMDQIRNKRIYSVK